MKKLLLILSLAPSIGLAGKLTDQYTVFAVSATQYWCKYSELPTSATDIGKVVDITSADKSTLELLDNWLSRVEINTNSEGATISLETAHPSGEPLLNSKLLVTTRCDEIQI